MFDWSLIEFAKRNNYKYSKGSVVGSRKGYNFKVINVFGRHLLTLYVKFDRAKINFNILSLKWNLRSGAILPGNGEVLVKLNTRTSNEFDEPSFFLLIDDLVECLNGQPFEIEEYGEIISEEKYKFLLASKKYSPYLYRTNIVIAILIFIGIFFLKESTYELASKTHYFSIVSSFLACVVLYFVFIRKKKIPYILLLSRYNENPSSLSISVFMFFTFVTLSEGIHLLATGIIFLMK